MRIVILGTGAMASLFAAKLNGLADTVMVGSWAEQLAAVATKGLTLVDPDGRRSQHAIRATNQIENVGPADSVLVLVKSWQTERSAQRAAQLLVPDGLALTLQNGLGNVERLAEVVGPGRAALGVTSEGANVPEPGVVVHAGSGQTALATMPETASRLAAIAELFEAAGFNTHLVENPTGLVWGKLAVNAGINPLTALMQVPNGYLVENEAARAIMMRAAGETARVAAAQGIELPYPDAGLRAYEVAMATAANMSSMVKDIKRGAPTEIEAITGEVVRAGRERQVWTPANEMLLNLVRALVARQQGV